MSLKSPLTAVVDLGRATEAATPKSESSKSETERPRWRARLLKAMRNDWTIDATVAVALTAWYYRYGFGHFHNHLFETFDQKGLIYFLEWLYHSFFGNGRILSIFDPNILYPNTDVLTWSETLLGFVPAYALFRSLTPNPIFAVSCMIVLAIFAGTLGMLRLGRDLTGRTAVIAAAIGGVGMLIASQENHLQGKGVSLLIWALFCLIRLARGSGRAAPWLIIVSSWLFLCSVYYAIMLAVFISSSFVLSLVLGRRRFVLWLRDLLRDVPAVRAIVALCISLPPVLWVSYHYLKVRAQFGGGYSLNDAVTYAGRLGSLLDAHGTSLIYKTIYFHWGSHESRMFYGLLTWVGVVLLVAVWQRYLCSAINRWIVLWLGFGALLAITLAMGPFERYALERGVHIPLPAYLYAKFFPGFSAIRAIGRFSIFASIFMALLAELGFRGVVDRLELRLGRSILVYGGLAALCVLEQTSVLRPERVDLIPRRSLYEAIRNLTPPNAIILELPVTRSQSHWEDIPWWTEQMLGSTIHWRRIPVGYTSLQSKTQIRLVSAYEALRTGESRPALFLKEVAEIGITHLVLNADLVPKDLATKLRTEFVKQDLAETAATPQASIFEMKPHP